MSKFGEYAVLWAVLTGTAWIRNGLRWAVGTGVVLAVLLLLPWYLGSRRPDRPPTRTERAAARGWLWLRRLAAWLLACLLMGVAGYEASRNPPAAVGWALAGLWLFWVGAVGVGRRRGIDDDLPLHRERKRRYGWWC